MLKKLFLAAVLTLGVVGMSVTTAPTQAYACKSGCFKKANAMYGHHHWKARHAYRKACHKHHHAGNKAHHKHRWFKH